jgi:hypothetical protein
VTNVQKAGLYASHGALFGAMVDSTEGYESVLITHDPALAGLVERAREAAKAVFEHCVARLPKGAVLE